mmetsp:Transcript_6515/g.20971  ORF Transcript_6515/g.20971 Transcript_6515/m.20971 type:complete len:492 (-) Transcript_6515:583-2058(-)
MAAHEISGDGSFDLDASPASRLSRCVVCLESKEVRVSTCADVRHGICGGCLSTALLQPKRRNPLTNADGSMGCVAAGCSGRFELRALLDVLETPEAKKHVLTIVAELRRASAPAAAQQTRRVDPKTDASKLETKRKQMLAAVDFMRKPSIASRPKESIDEYLRRNGVEDDVIAVARDVADGKRDAAGVVFEEETPAAPEAPAATGGTAHAPTFDFASSAAALAEIDAIWAETEKLISCDDLASLLNKLEHTKKKTLKRAMRDRITARANDVATQLQSEGWAVLDDFCAPDLVTRVLQDIAPVEPFYEASEIWVGADSTVGAQVSVPSVRGDRVLWMCGAHPRPAASADFTRNVDERGGVEPCEARVKDGLNKAKGGAARLSKSQVAKFAGVRDLFKALDAFVLGELVPRVDVLNDVTSRSDGMLAIYPGDGARFQAHVDNTTADGRRLTVLCYFNTDWAPDAGGALRVHPPSGPRDIARTHVRRSGNLDPR